MKTKQEKKQVWLHIVRSNADTNGSGDIVLTHDEKIISMNCTEGFGARHILGKKGYRLLVKHNGTVWECHRNKNTDFFKALDKKENRAARNEIWASKESDRWFSDDVWVAFSKVL
jgi:hypothetical protein